VATFSYADAVKLLGAQENKIVTALDKLLGGALLAGSGLDILGLLGWFDAKAEFIKLSRDLVAKVTGGRSSRYDRTQRLHAAHAVIVLVAFFEAFDELAIPFSTKGLGITKKEQLLHLSRELGPTCQPHELEVPLPTPDKPYEAHLSRLRKWYRDMGSQLVIYVQGMAVWDDLDETKRNRIDTVRDKLPDRAAVRYEELFRRLAADCPEVAFWWTLQDSQATRNEIRTALAQLEQSLTAITDAESPIDRQRTTLARKNTAVLKHPIIEPDQRVSAPFLGECYIDPHFQVSRSDVPFARTQWWWGRPVRDDMHRFLAGYLTSPHATTRPLLVLGDPGSGKSVLTKVLAARLPPSAFLVLRVELRTAPAEGGILEQIEYGLREALHEQVSWPALPAGNALRVVLLDGFDELLQATGVSQTGYLQKIARFQQDSTDSGHPLTVVVTSRISVADRAVAPDGMVVLRLVPFDEGQIDRWLDVWNRTNVQNFQESGLAPLTVDHVTEYPELAEQPLLLLMLALYDADSNALQHDSGTISRAELYERLLTSFARREVQKDGAHGDIEAAVETELERLSIVAFAMFNRGAQWVSEQDLNADMTALLPSRPPSGGMKEPLSAGETVLGRFFFIQQSQANRDQRTLRAYEFLHATFGEYLVARATWRIVLDLVEIERSRSRRRFAGEIDDSALYSFLSFVPLCVRGPVVEFLAEMADREDGDGEVADLLMWLFRAAGRARADRALGGYEPADVSVTTRYAAYDQNLFLLAVVAGRELSVQRLFDIEQGVADGWNGLALFWQSHFPRQVWQAVVDTFHVERGWRDDVVPDLMIRLAKPGDIVPVSDLDWFVAAGGTNRPDRYRSIVDYAKREGYFLCDEYRDLMNKVIDPIDVAIPAKAWERVNLPSGGWTIGASTLLELFFAEDGRRHVDKMLGWDGMAEFTGEDLFGDLVMDLLRLRFNDQELMGLAANQSLTSSIAFWNALCDRIGKGSEDHGLLAWLCRIWDLKRALAIIPAVVLETWLRLAESGTKLPREAPALRDVLTGIDLHWIARARPDLITRARNVLGARGQLDTVTWPPP
jgi:hypothetical protein